MNYSIDKEIRTPSGNNYDSKVELGIHRRQEIRIADRKLIASSRYTIKGMRYKVNSIFDLENVRDSEEGLKRLMISDANKAS